MENFSQEKLHKIADGNHNKYDLVTELLTHDQDHYSIIVKETISNRTYVLVWEQDKTIVPFEVAKKVQGFQFPAGKTLH